VTEAELLEDRKSGVGGSDVASVLNIGWGCALRLYRSKRGEIPDYPRKETGAMKLGKILEPFIADEFRERTGAQVVQVPVARDKQYPELLVHADRLLCHANGGSMQREWGVMEIKALGARPFLEMKREGLSIDYSLQIQWGMLIHGVPWGCFVVSNRDTWEQLDWDVYRDDELCGMVKARVLEFWANVQAGNPPDRLDPDDRRCQTCEYRRTCQGDALIHIDPKAKIEQDESLRPLLVEYSERKAIFDAAEESLEIQKALIKDAMGDRAAAGVDKSKIYYGQRVPRCFNTDKMGAAISLLGGKVDYDGTFLPLPPVFIEANFKEAGKPFRSLRIFE
jgi:predicted phage-related endonuclease